ncbi:MAG: AtpZ/AtpI family protein [Ignavibacteriales bacterium]|nr:AtpZ/AtpI family protein [Ignavibacteriales bacterium]
MSSKQYPAGNDPHDKNRQSLFESLREYSPYLTLGFQLAAAVVGFFLLGAWLDDRWETSPWLKLLGLLVGSIGGFVKFFKTVANLEKKDRLMKKDSSSRET